MTPKQFLAWQIEMRRRALAFLARAGVNGAGLSDRGVFERVRSYAESSSPAAGEARRILNQLDEVTSLPADLPITPSDSTFRGLGQQGRDYIGSPDARRIAARANGPRKYAEGSTVISEARRRELLAGTALGRDILRQEGQPVVSAPTDAVRRFSEPGTHAGRQMSAERRQYLQSGGHISEERRRFLLSRTELGRQILRQQDA